MSTSLRRTLGCLAALTLLSAGPLATIAHAQDCKFERQDGTSRECTFTERYGKCLVTALESYYECYEDADGRLRRLGCDTAVQVDLAACSLEMIGDVLRLLSPF